MHLHHRLQTVHFRLFKRAQSGKRDRSQELKRCKGKIDVKEKIKTRTKEEFLLKVLTKHITQSVSTLFDHEGKCFSFPVSTTLKLILVVRAKVIKRHNALCILHALLLIQKSFSTFHG